MRACMCLCLVCVCARMGLSTGLYVCVSVRVCACLPAWVAWLGMSAYLSACLVVFGIPACPGELRQIVPVKKKVPKKKVSQILTK